MLNLSQQKLLKKPREKKTVEFASWLHEALKVLKPPEKITVVEFADRFRILDDRTSAEPGRWRTARTPYLADIMNSFIDPLIEEIIFCKCTQVGGTEAIFNCFAYSICIDPGPTLFVYPTDKLAENVSDNRIQPMIKASPEIYKHFRENESKLLELQFDNMYAVLTGANSPSGVSSMPIKNLFEDERDKFPTNAGKEAPPEELADERTKTFTNKKKVKASTPVFEKGIWKDYEKANVQCKFYVPCPHCGEFQTFVFDQIKWNKNYQNSDEAKNTSFYECIFCKGIIHDANKPKMLAMGKWKDDKSGKWLKDIEENKTKVGFHLNTIYSPWITFGDVAKKFLDTKDDPLLFQNFKNSWMAEPWKNKELSLNENIVEKRQTNVPELVVPDDTLILTAGVDVQRDCFYFCIRAWSYSLTSQNIAHGQLDTWDQVEELMERQVFYDKDNRQYFINLCCIDSGDQTVEVYDFCALHPDWAIPSKGSSYPLKSNFNLSTINKTESKAHGMRLAMFDTNRYKDMIAGRLQRQNGKGSWMVYKDCDKEYMAQVTSEERVIVKKSGREVAVWQPKTAHTRNHYLDCETNAFLAADLLNIRFLQPPAEEQKKQQFEQRQQENSRENFRDIREHKSSFFNRR